MTRNEKIQQLRNSIELTEKLIKTMDEYVHLTIDSGQTELSALAAGITCNCHALFVVSTAVIKMMEMKDDVKRA